MSDSPPEQPGAGLVGAGPTPDVTHDLITKPFEQDQKKEREITES